jgi:hypothetical protein
MTNSLYYEVMVLITAAKCFIAQALVNMEKNKIKSCHNPFDSKLKMKIN